jgi:hypothetical protein
LRPEKKRIALSYLVPSPGTVANDETGSATVLAVHETHGLVELLSNCLQGRGKDGAGGYSAATFTLKGVLFGMRCILSERTNRDAFVKSGGGDNARRLNSLLLKALARYALSDGGKTIMDAEAAEHAVTSMYHMTLHGLDGGLLEFPHSLSHATFLPEVYGTRKKLEGREVLVGVLIAYLNRVGFSDEGRHHAEQILLRVDYLKFAGNVSDLVSVVYRRWKYTMPISYDVKVY